jgi:hypothetical protein
MWEFILTNLSCHESKLDENNRSRPAGRGGCPLSANADGNVDGGDDGGGERETSGRVHPADIVQPNGMTPKRDDVVAFESFARRPPPRPLPSCRFRVVVFDAFIVIDFLADIPLAPNRTALYARRGRI